MYFVYENWQAEDKAVVHKGTCAHCNDGKGTGRGTEGEAHGRWHKGFLTDDEAYKWAKSLNRKTTKYCGNCFRNK